MYLSGLCDDLFVLSRPMKSGLCGHEVVVHVLQLKTPLCFFYYLLVSIFLILLMFILCTVVDLMLLNIIFLMCGCDNFMFMRVLLSTDLDTMGKWTFLAESAVHRRVSVSATVM